MSLNILKEQLCFANVHMFFVLNRLERSDLHILKHSMLACWCQCDLCSPWLLGITNRQVGCKKLILPLAWDVCSQAIPDGKASWKNSQEVCIQESGCYIFFKQKAACFLVFGIFKCSNVVPGLNKKNIHPICTPTHLPITIATHCAKHPVPIAMFNWSSTN